MAASSEGILSALPFLPGGSKARAEGIAENGIVLGSSNSALADQAVLWALSTTDGKKLAEYPLDSPPVFDGLIAANGRLYITTIDVIVPNPVIRTLFGVINCWAEPLL